MAKATLLVIQGADQGNRFELTDRSVAIGRGVRNDVRILDTEVSRRHAALSPEDGAYVITDQNSANGTRVNGRAVQSCRLSNGDRIQLGRTVLLFSQAAEDRFAGDRSAGNIAEQVNLVGQHDAPDRSSIVGEVGQDITPTQFADAVDPETRALVQTLANLQTLYRISEETVSPSISLEQLLQRILDLTIEVVGADRGCILLRDSETRELAPQAFSVGHGGDSSAKMPVSRSIIDYVLQKGQGVRTSDARTDQRFAPGQSILQAGIREAMCVPMQGRHELAGVVYVDTMTPPERAALQGAAVSKFSEDQLRLLVAIGRQSALAVESYHYQQALLKAERLAAVGQTIAMLSHHIKNILQGVRGGSYLIDMGLKDHNEDLVRKGWGIVDKNQSKIYHLVMDMLSFSTERQPALETASLNETVGEVCELMQARAEECDVEFETDLAADLPSTVFDKDGIHRAVLNVVTNAIDAVDGRSDAKVRVQTGYDSASDRLFVVIADNGPGIPEDQIARIFNIFESTKGGRGTGLGLAVSQKIIREHGGEIAVESQPGEGCRFTLTWPRMDEEQRSHTTETTA